MFCCLVAALLLGPLGFWAMPRARAEGGADCCAVGRRGIVVFVFAAVAMAALCLAAFLFLRTGSVDFRHICSFFPRA
jgi:hypothetical protein